MKNNIKILKRFLLVTMSALCAVHAASTVDASPIGISLQEKKNWKKFEVKDFYFFAPDSLRVEQSKCLDSDCYRYKSDNLTLNIDTHFDSQYPTAERTYESYSETRFEVDEWGAWTWFFQDASDKVFYAGARFIRPTGPSRRALTFAIVSRDSGMHQTAEKIFSSVRFKKKLR